MPSKGPFARVKLSKKFFMGLKDGLFVASNCTHNNLKPIFAEEVLPLNIRELQWQMAVHCNASHWLCEVFESRADFEEYYSDMVMRLRIGEL